MYAIIADSGTQFKVTTGEVIRIDRPLDQPLPDVITFDQVLLVGGGDGKAKIGAPLLGGATVTGTVLGVMRDKKIDIQKYKRRKGYHKKIGHRQNYVEVKIDAING